MKTKWLYLTLAGVILISTVSMILWKQQHKNTRQQNQSQLVSALESKVNSLYGNADQEFLQVDVTEEDILATQDELERILIGQNLMIGDLRADNLTTKKWFDLKESLDQARSMLTMQDKVNQLFLAEDFRHLDDSAETDPSNVIDPDQLFEEGKPKENTQASTSEDETEDTTTKEKKAALETLDAGGRTLQAINGNMINQYLIIADPVTKESLTSTLTSIKKHPKQGSWTKSLELLLINATEQLDIIDAATLTVMELFTGESVKPAITKTQYEAALAQVKKIYNQQHQRGLMEKMEQVALAIGAEFQAKEYPFEDFSDKDLVSFIATQTNQDWWKKPVSFDITIKNNSTKNVSFAYGRFAIQKSNKTFAPSQYELKSDVQRITVKKGEQFTLTGLEFKFSNETLVKSSQGSQLVYILDKDDVSNPIVSSILTVTFAEKKSETEEKSEINISHDQLNKLRTQLQELGVDDSKLSDAKLIQLATQAAKDGITEKELLALICKELGLDYETLLKQKEQQKDPTNDSGGTGKSE